MRINYSITIYAVLVLGLLTVVNTQLTSDNGAGKATSVIPAQKTFYVNSGNMLLAKVSDEKVFIHSDTSNSPVSSTDGSGSLLRNSNYAPFGSEFEGEYSDDTKFLGKQESYGNVLTNLRIYDPDISRFYNPDPLVRDTLSTYSYSQNNPLKLSDPDGMKEGLINMNRAYGSYGVFGSTQIKDGTFGGATPYWNLGLDVGLGGINMHVLARHQVSGEGSMQGSIAPSHGEYMLDINKDFSGVNVGLNHVSGHDILMIGPNSVELEESGMNVFERENTHGGGAHNVLYAKRDFGGLTLGAGLGVQSYGVDVANALLEIPNSIILSDESTLSKDGKLGYYGIAKYSGLMGPFAFTAGAVTMDANLVGATGQLEYKPEGELNGLIISAGITTNGDDTSANIGAGFSFD